MQIVFNYNSAEKRVDEQCCAFYQSRSNLNYIHVETDLLQNGFYLGGKTATSLLKSFCSNVARQIACTFCVASETVERAKRERALREKARRPCILILKVAKSFR